MKKSVKTKDDIAKKIMQLVVKNQDYRDRKIAEKTFDSEEKKNDYIENLLYRSYTKDCTIFEYFDDLKHFMAEGIVLYDILCLWHKEKRDQFFSLLFTSKETTPFAIMVDVLKQMKETW